MENKHIFYEIYEKCNYKFINGCGSYFFDGTNYKYCDLMYEKQLLLYNNMKNVKNVLEIGTYMGHSLLIMLLSNPELKITSVDIDDKFTLHAVTVLNNYFNNAITFIHSDSLIALKNMNEKFDFFHTYSSIKATQFEVTSLSPLFLAPLIPPCCALIIFIFFSVK